MLRRVDQGTWNTLSHGADSHMHMRLWILESGYPSETTLYSRAMFASSLRGTITALVRGVEGGRELLAMSLAWNIF
jgi:hypothetical protein